MKIDSKKLTISALLAAMITILTAYIGHIPVGSYGGYIHFGDSMIYIAACLLPTPYAVATATIGGGLADLLTSPVWAPATIIIKALITVFFSNSSIKLICTRNVLATIIALIISPLCYLVAESLIVTQSLRGIKALIPVSVPVNIIQSVGSAIIFIILGIVLDKMDFKRKFLP